MTEPQNHGAARRPRAGTVIAIVMVVAGLVSAVVITVRRQNWSQDFEERKAAGPQRIEELQVISEVADFSLTERSGKAVTRADLLGRVWVASFFFTYCGPKCPVMTANMGKIHREYAGREEPQFVSFTADPMRDTVEALAEYARLQQADERWWFLTGKDPVLATVARSMDLPYAVGDPSAHSTRFVLIDRQGRVRGHFDGMSGPDLDRLRQALRVLLDEPRN